MDKIRQGPKSKIPRKSTVALVEPEIKLADKGRTAVVYQIMALLVFVALGFFIYSNTLKSPFFFDDWVHIQENRHIRLTELDFKDIIAAGFKSPSPTRPIANISFALNYYFHRYNVIGYHCTNICIHILTGIFLYLFVKNTLSIPLLHRRYHNYRQIAFFAALLWLVHPLQTQSVTYIVQRMNSLAAMFYILSLLLYVKGRLASRQRRGSWPWFTGCILSGLLALGCKEMTVTLPVFILLYEWYFFQDLNTTWLKRYLPYVTGVFIIFGLLGLWYLGSNPLEKILSVYALREFTLTERLLTQPRVVIYYISLLAYPHPGRLNLDYDFAISHSLTAPSTTLPCIGAVIGLIVLAFYIAKRERLLSFCILWFFGNLAIESSVMGLELVFEHRLYLPSMLVCLAVVVLAWRYIKQDWVRVVVFCILTVLFSGWSYERNSVWSDPVTLWKDCVAKSPKKSRPHNNLGDAIHAQGKLDEAISHYCRALQINPNNSKAHYNLAFALAAQGKLDDAIRHFRQALQVKPDYTKAHIKLANVLAAQGELDEAIKCYRQALQIEPSFAEAHHNLGIALAAQGKSDEAISHYRQALQIEPDYADAHNNLACALGAQGKSDEAITYFTSALAIRPDFVDAHYNLGRALAKQGRLDEAISHYRQALQVKPDYTDVHSKLGILLQLQGKLDEAVTHYRHALRLNPDWIGCLNNLAWLLATHKEAKFHDPKEAIQLAERACKLTNYEKPALLDTLATAYASVGRFPQAIETAEKAVNFALSAGKKELAQQIQSHLQLYKAGQPYRELLPAPVAFPQTD